MQKDDDPEYSVSYGDARKPDDDRPGVAIPSETLESIVDGIERLRNREMMWERELEREMYVYSHSRAPVYEKVPVYCYV